MLAYKDKPIKSRFTRNQKIIFGIIIAFLSFFLIKSLFFSSSSDDDAFVYNGKPYKSYYCKHKCFNGECLGNGECKCYLGYKGQDCREFVCRNECSNNGQCVGPDTCDCNIGWYGFDCSKRWRKKKIEQNFCLKFNRCSGHGQCLATDTCICNPGWVGEACDKKVEKLYDLHGVVHANEDRGKKTVSVLLPLLGGDRIGDIKVMLKSVLEQDYKELDIIIITEFKLPVGVKEILEKDKRVKLIGGPAFKKLNDLLNVGFHFAVGKYYTYILSNSILEKNFISKMLEEFNDPEVTLVYADYEVLHYDDKVLLSTEIEKLPEDSETLNFNYKKQNFIGPAFMYRGTVGKLLGDFRKLHGHENEKDDDLKKHKLISTYDYWMRMNDHFKFKHISHSLMKLKTYRTEVDLYHFDNDKQINEYYTNDILRRYFSSRKWDLYLDAYLFDMVADSEKAKFENVKLWQGKYDYGKKTIIFLDSLTKKDDRFFITDKSHKSHLCTVFYHNKWTGSEIYHEKILYNGHGIDLVLTTDINTMNRIHLFTKNVFFVPTMNAALRASVTYCNSEVFLKEMHDTSQTEFKTFPKISLKNLDKFHKTKLAIVVDNFGFPGGRERIVKEVAVEVQKHGFEVYLVNAGLSGPIFDEIKNLGIIPIYLQGSEEKKLEEFKKLLQEKNIEVVNSHYSLFGYKIVHELKIPYIQTLHNEYVWFNEKQIEEMRQADEFTDAYICISSKVAKYADLKLHLDVKKMLILRGGVDIKRFENLKCPSKDELLKSIQSSYYYSSDHSNEQPQQITDKIILQVGSLVPIKGAQFSIRAMKEVVKKYPNTRLLIVGKGMDDEFPAKLRSLVRENNLEKNVFLLGHREDIPCLLSLADISIHPSIIEGWSLALAEAVYMDKEIITANTGGARDLLRRFSRPNSYKIIPPPYKSILDVDNIHKLALSGNDQYVANLASSIISFLEEEGFKPKFQDHSQFNPLGVNTFEPMKLKKLKDENLSGEFIYEAYAKVFQWIEAGGTVNALKDVLHWNYR